MVEMKIQFNIVRNRKVKMKTQFNKQFIQRPFDLGSGENKDECLPQN